jgi:hypothetical protein
MLDIFINMTTARTLHATSKPSREIKKGWAKYLSIISKENALFSEE